MTDVPKIPAHIKGKRTPKEYNTWNVPKKAGVMAESRAAWLTTTGLDFILFIGHDDFVPKSDLFDPDTPPVTIEFRRPGVPPKRNQKVSLTQLTLAELEELEKFFAHAFEKARPICKKLDERAQEAYRNGHDGYARLYRPIPRFIDRERVFTEHGPSLQERPARLVDGVESEDSEGIPGPRVGLSRPLIEEDSGADRRRVPDEGEDSLESEHDEPEAGSTP